MSVFRRAIDFVLPVESRNGQEFRKRLEWLMLLRLVVTTLLLGATIFFQIQQIGAVYAESAVPLYVLIGATFLLSIIYAYALPRMPYLWQFSFFQVMVDVLYSTVLIYFTGGESSIFSLLYVFPIITSGLLHLRRGALITALVSSVLFGLLINLQYYRIIPARDWPWLNPWAGSTPAYILWVWVVHFTIFLFVAILSSSAAEQLRAARLSLTRREMDYRELSALHTSIVRSIPSGIITTDETDRITFVNTAGLAQLGVPFARMLGAPVSTIFPILADKIGNGFNRGETYRTMREKDGEPVHIELSVADLQAEDGTLRGRLIVFQDVTRLRKMEERIRLSEQQAAFVRIAAGMAHEIRNPLASIRGATEMLGQSASTVNHEQRLLNIVIRESDRLNSLLTDFLRTVGSRQPKKIRVMLSDLVEETVALLAGDPRIREGVSLVTLINKGVEVEGEPARLRQALWNLLANAADATCEGDTIRVVLETDENEGYAILRVQDTGSGIPPEVKDRIFEPFTTTKERGTGLGLALVLSVIESHDGTVEVQSAPGSGTIFTVRLPAAAAGGGTDERR